MFVLFNLLPLGSSLPFLFVVDDTTGATLGAVVTTLDGDVLVAVEVILILLEEVFLRHFLVVLEH